MRNWVLLKLDLTSPLKETYCDMLPRKLTYSKILLVFEFLFLFFKQFLSYTNILGTSQKKPKTLKLMEWENPKTPEGLLDEVFLLATQYSD
jgi:hypothetical protein